MAHAEPYARRPYLDFSKTESSLHLGLMMKNDTDPENEQTRRLANGQWGGEGIRLNVGTSLTTIEYPCADGEIRGSFRIDRNGRFRLAGIHTTLRPGPIHENEKPESEPAEYEGSVSGDKMVIRVTLTKSKEVIGEFQLVKAKQVRLHRCL
ncbi:MAG TPA: hypothetical protein PKD26_17125 [Pyrinomonadaceae bacterium]|nr:hypothetical protein [Pyrinomonadaceae bacterium]